MTGGAAARISTDAFTVAFVAYLAAMLAAFHHLAFRRRVVWALAIALTGAGALAHLVSAVARGLAAGRIPLGNMYEYSLVLSLLVVLAYLVFVEGMGRIRTVGGFVLAFVLLTMAVAALFLHVGPAPLVPALNSYWRQVHVGSMIVSSALLALGGILTMLYLVQEASGRRRAARLRPIAGGGVGADLGTARASEAGGGRARAAAPGDPAPVGRPRPARPPDDRLRLPHLDLRGHRRGDLGGARLGPVLGLGPQGDLVLRDLGHLRGGTSTPGRRRAGAAGGRR
ncbi:MAG: hypothetical protein KatS3mg014_2106 [Actinomycetota bacterium]|nr:MAG: hypothetical protein KatS3mg014_2106 [Actinomycetota bacterium]